MHAAYGDEDMRADELADFLVEKELERGIFLHHQNELCFGAQICSIGENGYVTRVEEGDSLWMPCTWLGMRMP
jgi:hypothetical protein